MKCLLLPGVCLAKVYNIFLLETFLIQRSPDGIISEISNVETEYVQLFLVKTFIYLNLRSSSILEKATVVVAIVIGRNVVIGRLKPRAMFGSCNCQITTVPLDTTLRLTERAQCTAFCAPIESEIVIIMIKSEISALIPFTRNMPSVK